MEYPKIQTVWLRSPESGYKKLMDGAWSKPEFQYLSLDSWLWTEKVDGMNIRVIWDGTKRSFSGRTDNACLPGPLYNRLEDLFPNEIFNKVFGATPAILFGEGFGPKIQKGGGNYGSQQDFVLFDAFVGKRWTETPDLDRLAEYFGINKVPVHRVGNLLDAISYAGQGFKSHWGEFLAEGLVCKPALGWSSLELTNRVGERVITKIKYKDFDHDSSEKPSSVL
jgi:hypothetical protein